jgi:hypothetical protein
MTDEQWAVFEQLLAHGWSAPRQWDQPTGDAYRLVLDGYDPDQVLLALQRLIHRGGPFRPSIAEVVAAINADAALPTFDEAYNAIWEKGGYVWTGRLDGLHELVVLFIEARGGLEGCRRERVADPDYGGAVRQQLATAWAELVDRYEARKREGRALEALGRSKRGELAKPDYLATLSAEPGAGDQAAATSRLPEGRGEPARTASAGRLRRPDPLAAPGDDKPDSAAAPGDDPSPPSHREPTPGGGT